MTDLIILSYIVNVYKVYWIKLIYHLGQGPYSNIQSCRKSEKEKGGYICAPTSMKKYKTYPKNNRTQSHGDGDSKTIGLSKWPFLKPYPVLTPFQLLSSIASSQQDFEQVVPLYYPFYFAKHSTIHILQPIIHQIKTTRKDPQLLSNLYYCSNHKTWLAEA